MRYACHSQTVSQTDIQTSESEERTHLRLLAEGVQRTVEDFLRQSLGVQLVAVLHCGVSADH